MPNLELPAQAMSPKTHSPAFKRHLCHAIRSCHPCLGNVVRIKEVEIHAPDGGLGAVDANDAVSEVKVDHLGRSEGRERRWCFTISSDTKKKFKHSRTI